MKDLADLLSRLASQPPERVAQALVREKARGLPPRLTPASPTPDPGAPLYQKARDHFARHEQRLREEAAVTDRLLDGLRQQHPAPSVPAAPPQLSLDLRGSPHTPATGRFVVSNDLRRPARLSFRPSEATLSGTDRALWVPLTLDPPRPTLGPGARQTLTLRIDPTPLGGAPGQQVSLDLDVLADDTVVLKVWVTLTLDPPLPEATP